MSDSAEDVVTMTLLELPGTWNWIPGSSRKVARKILDNLKENGAVISFPVKPSVVVLSEQDISMQRLVEKERRDG